MTRTAVKPRVPPWVTARGMRTEIPPVKLRVAKLIAALKDGGSFVELAQESGLHEWIVREYVRALWDQQVVRILAWDKDKSGVARVPVFIFVSGDVIRDAPRPRRKPGNIISKAYRARKKLRLVFSQEATDASRET